MVERRFRPREEERIIAESKLHIVPLILPILLTIIGIVASVLLDPSADLYQFLALVLIVGGIWGTVYSIATRRSTYLVLTDERLVGQTGAFRRHHVDVVIHHVDRVATKRAFLARLLGYGTILITARGEGNQKLQFRQIADAEALAEKIRQQMSAPLARSAVTVEQIRAAREGRA